MKPESASPRRRERLRLRYSSMQIFKNERRLVIAALLALPGFVRAADNPAVGVLKYEGQSLPRRLLLSGHELQLNGVGVRGWYKAFVAALYLGKPAATASDATAQPGPKRLQLHMRFDLPADAFADAFRKGVMRNAGSTAAAAALETRVAAFEAAVKALEKVQKGDVIDLDLEPARGMLFSVNGTLRGSPIAGDDFYAALLRAFIGEQPYDDKLKAGLLGKPV
jgi:hypothetical protein